MSEEIPWGLLLKLFENYFMLNAQLSGFTWVEQIAGSGRAEQIGNNMAFTENIG